MLQEAGKKTMTIIDTAYEGYVSHFVVAQYLVMPYIRHVCVLLSSVKLCVLYVHLGSTYRV